MEGLRDDVRDGQVDLNPVVLLMAESGALGNLARIAHPAGMPGPVARPSGKIIETPIVADFREGLGVLDAAHSALYIPDPVTVTGYKGSADSPVTSESWSLKVEEDMLREPSRPGFGSPSTRRRSGRRPEPGDR